MDSLPSAPGPRINHRSSRFTSIENPYPLQPIQNNLAILALNKLLRSLPREQRGFFKDCRIAAVIPYFMPRGDFTTDSHAMNLDTDQLDWLLARRPEFKVVDDTDNNVLRTGGKIISISAFVQL